MTGFDPVDLDELECRHWSFTISGYDGLVNTFFSRLCGRVELNRFAQINTHQIAHHDHFAVGRFLLPTLPTISLFRAEKRHRFAGLDFVDRLFLESRQSRLHRCNRTTYQFQFDAQGVTVQVMGR